MLCDLNFEYYLLLFGMLFRGIAQKKAVVWRESA